MSETSAPKTPDAWEEKVANAERETVSKCCKTLENLWN